MGNIKRPLKRGILTVFIIFITSLCLVLCFMQFVSYRASLYEKYEFYIENVLTYTRSAIDVEDLKECILSGKESEKLQELQNFMNDLKDNLGLHFLYIIIPVSTEPTDNMVNVLAAYDEEERKEEVPPVYLNMPSGESYSAATAKKYLEAYQSGTLSFFEERSEWGDDYTGLVPLFDSQNEPVAALCMDVDILEIHKDLWKHTLDMLLAVLFLGVLFAVAFLLWADVNIVSPLKKLETCVVKFAAKSHLQSDPDTLVMNAPLIHTGNEVESLSLAVQKLSEDMRDYLSRFTSAQKELAEMSIITQRDRLTHVGNKNAFEQYVRDMERGLEKEKMNFSIIALDVNGLMSINNFYGHEKGDAYLKNCCNLICDVYKRSPVFRVGGDEFVVILTDRDYWERDELLQELKKEFAHSRENAQASPWERLSISAVSADFDKDRDTSVIDVLERAEKQMFLEKEKLRVIPG